METLHEPFYLIARSWVARRLTQPTVLLLACFVCAGAALAQKPAEKPRVPPGVDPGGVAVAIIGNGIDYTRPEIAARLARDGEGEIIGWDFVDDDRRPYEQCSQPRVTACMGLFGVFTSQRLVVLRAGLHSPQTLVAAVRAAADMGTKTVLVTLAPLPERFLIEAARAHPQLYFIGIVSNEAPARQIILRDGYLAVPVNISDEISYYPPSLAAQFAQMAALCREAKRIIADCIRTEGLTGADRNFAPLIPDPEPSPLPKP